MKKSILIAVAIVLAGNISLVAQDKKAVVLEEQNAERLQQQVENLTATLELDTDQITKVTAIYEDAESKLNDVKTTLVHLREKKVYLDKSDQAAVDAFNTDYKVAMEQRKAILEDRKTAVTNVLTDPQKERFLKSEK